MPTKKYRVAVVGGAGTWGRFYLRAYANHPDCEIVALVDRARDRRGAFAERYGVETVFDTVDELFAVEVPDIVSIILPVGHNPETVIACAEAGVKAVSCEKPIAVELSQADEMVRVCRERGTAFGCGTGYWDAPYLLEIADWIRAGNIGPLTGAAIPGGLPTEVSGGGCVQLTIMRLLTGMEVEWAEGWTLPPQAGWMPPVEFEAVETDSPSLRSRWDYPVESSAKLSSHKQSRKGSVPLRLPEKMDGYGLALPSQSLSKDRGLLQRRFSRNFWIVPEKTGLHQPLNGSCGQWIPARCTLQWTRLPSSTRNRHRSKTVRPTVDMDGFPCRWKIVFLKIYPHPYRLKGGDVAGWQSIGYTGPPSVA